MKAVDLICDTVLSRAAGRLAVLYVRERLFMFAFPLMLSISGTYSTKLLILTRTGGIHVHGENASQQNPTHARQT